MTELRHELAQAIERNLQLIQELHESQAQVSSLRSQLNKALDGKRALERWKKRWTPAVNWFTATAPSVSHLVALLDQATTMFGQGTALPAIYHHFSPQAADIGAGGWYQNVQGNPAHEYLPFPVAAFPNFDHTPDVDYPRWLYRWWDDRPPNPPGYASSGMYLAVKYGYYCYRYGHPLSLRLVDLMARRFNDGFGLFAQIVTLRDSITRPPPIPRARSASV